MPALRASLPMVLALALALAACAGLPDQPTEKRIKTPADLPSADAFSAPAGDWPQIDWWHAYGDPQLASLIAEGLDSAPDIATARARLDKANAASRLADAATLPSLDASGRISADKQSYNGLIPAPFLPKGYRDNAQLQATLTYDFDFWGKNRAALAAALSEAGAAEAELAQARLVLSTAIAQAYAQFANLAADRRVADRSVAVRNETLNLVTRRVGQGLDTKATLKQAEAEYFGARADLAAIDEDIALARNQMAALIGTGPDRGLHIEEPSPTALNAFGLPAHLSADLLSRRPDIVAARRRTEAAMSRIDVAKAQFYPDIDLIADIGLQSLGAYKLFRAGSDTGSIGPTVTLPIFDGGALRANLKNAGADFDSAVALYDSTLSQALHEIADAAVSERALTTRLKESRDALAASEDAYRLAKLRYEGALSDYQTVLSAENTLLLNRRRVADLEARAFILEINLVRALGGGFSERL